MKTPKKNLKTIQTDSGVSTTIVGGQPKTRTQRVSIPVGIEQLMYLAATNSLFKKRYLDDPVAAANEVNIRLTPIEQEMLKRQDPNLLKSMVERFNPEVSKRGRPSGITAAIALTLATSTASVTASSCTESEDDSTNNIADGGNNIPDGGKRMDADEAGDSQLDVDVSMTYADAGVRIDGHYHDYLSDGSDGQNLDIDDSDSGI